MKRPCLNCWLFFLLFQLVSHSQPLPKTKLFRLPPNGIELPKDYKDWRLIAPSYRSDHGSVRAILGNDIAIEAARAGKTNPWPDGAILAKIV